MPEESMADEAIDTLEAFAEYAQAEYTPNLLFKEHPETESRLRGLSKTDAALEFGALLLDPRYRANCVRLEALVHLCLSAEGGDGIINSENLANSFQDLGTGRCGLNEDPAEDVFVGNIVTDRGNYLVLPGTWEAGAFYLQIFVDVLSKTPDDPLFAELKANVRSLLTLSNEVCRRVGLTRYALGGENPLKELETADLLPNSTSQLVFTDADLANLGITKSDLEPFIFTADWQSQLHSLPIAHSPLHQLPLVTTDTGIGLVLPTATTFAIRMFITRRLIEAGYLESLVNTMGAVYSDFLRTLPHIRVPLQVPLHFNPSGPRTAEFMFETDIGRYLQVILVLDDFTDVKRSGVAGDFQGLRDNSHFIHHRTKAAFAHASSKPNYRQGMTLVVYCGIGRGGGIAVRPVDTSWRTELISAPDLDTLVFTGEFSIAKFWNAIEAFDALEAAGIHIINANGLLNRIGWMQSNDWQVLPHSQVPKSFRGGGVIQIPTNSLLATRALAHANSDRVGIVHPELGCVACRLVNDSLFTSDQRFRIYVPETVFVGEKLPFVYLTDRCACWCTVKGNIDGELYERWSMLMTWIPRVLDAIQTRSPNMSSSFQVSVNFANMIKEGEPSDIPGIQEIRDSIEWSIHKDKNQLSVTVGRPFELGLQSPANISESALASQLCSAFLALGEVAVGAEAMHQLEERIVPTVHIRHLHLFQTRAFRDFVGDVLEEEPIDVDHVDSAILRLGLAFRVEPRDEGRFGTRSKRSATKLLNDIVSHLEQELSTLLRQFNRRKVVQLALINHERAVFSRQRWMRTAKANLACRLDEDNARNVISKRDVELSSVIFASQIIAEIATCECPATGGGIPGRMDFVRMMVLVNAIAEYGGWSDAIHLDALSPNLKITALGDVQADIQFRQEVMMPFAKAHSDDRLTRNVADFEENYVPAKSSPGPSELDEQFKLAWAHEFICGIDELRLCMDVLEDIGISLRKAVFGIRRSEVLRALREAGVEHADQFLDSFTLAPRENWKTIPAGSDVKDVQLWRFRRQLSTVRRPIFQLESSGDALLVIAPGLIRQSLVYVIANYFEGTFPDRHYRTPSIKKWHDRRRRERGSTFAADVAAEFRRCGWECKTEQDVRTLVKKGRDSEFRDMREYGDVDVIAWSAKHNRVLMIECKHLYQGKTPGEVAEQLRDYRGEIVERNGKQKRDDLRKHLDRLEVLQARKSAVCRALGIDGSPEIEGWIVFKNPVPMLFNWKKFEHVMKIATFDDIPQIASGGVALPKL